MEPWPNEVLMEAYWLGTDQTTYTHVWEPWPNDRKKGVQRDHYTVDLASLKQTSARGVETEIRLVATRKIVEASEVAAV